MTDHGLGIAAENHHRIFEKFYRAGSARKGFGLGLPICRAIVTAHDGRIWVESQEGKGSRFTVLLPIIGAAVEAPRPQGAPRRGSGRVLVVDDEPLAREAACQMLLRLGYEPVGDSVQLLFLPAPVREP